MRTPLAVVFTIAGLLFIVAKSAVVPDAVAADAKSAAAKHSSLSVRRYNEVAFVTTHNAMSNRDERWIMPNQTHNISRQLRDGVRGLMLDIHYDDGQVYLAHGKPALGRKLLVDGLKEIGTFLDEDKEAIVTIIFESYVKADDVRAAFTAAGLEEHAHVQPAGKPWPTLAEMIRNNRRLVVFTDREGGAFPWYHDVWKYCWDTDWANRRSEDFSSKLKRGRQENQLFILNHFLTNPFPSPKFAEEVNRNPFFAERIRKVIAETGRRPNFVTVDFYEIGDVQDVVAELNNR